MKEEILEVLELLETESKEINDAQRSYLKERYNTYVKFRYVEGHLCWIFETTEEGFNRMERYLGLEYERDCQDLLIKSNGKVIVSYHGSDRVDVFMDQFENLKKE